VFQYLEHRQHIGFDDVLERSDEPLVRLQLLVPPAVLGGEHCADEHLVDRRVELYPRISVGKGRSVAGEKLRKVWVLKIADPVGNAEMAEVDDRRDVSPAKVRKGQIGEFPVVLPRTEIGAVNRRTGNVEWKADDLGNCAEMALIGTTLFVRTGGQFTRLKDGESESKGPYGVSAIDTRNGETIWRFKGADKGLTNFVFSDVNTILIADRDDLMSIDAKSGRRRDEIEHKIEKAQFVLINERGDAVVGGRDEIAAFNIDGSRRADKSVSPALAGGRNHSLAQVSFISGAAPPANAGGTDLSRSGPGSFNELWRTRHKAPSRGAFRIIAGIALRATALYFRYGGLATSAIGLARGGLSLMSAANSFRWSGLRSRFGSFDLTTLASNATRNYVTRRIYSYGSLTRLPNVASRIGDFQVITPAGIRGRITSGIIDRATPSGSEVRESILDRLDPVRQVEKLSSYLLRRKRLAELRSGGPAHGADGDPIGI